MIVKVRGLKMRRVLSIYVCHLTFLLETGVGRFEKMIFFLTTAAMVQLTPELSSPLPFPFASFSSA